MSQIICPACGHVTTFVPGDTAACSACGHKFEPGGPRLNKDTTALPKFLGDTIAEVIPTRPSEGTSADKLFLPKDRRFYLEVQNGESAGARFVVDRPSLIIGRRDDADLVLSDRGVSRHHARLEVSGRQLRLIDLQTPNGTFVGHERIESAPLRHGDEFTIAVVRIVLHQENFF